MSYFHPLKIKDIRKETADAVVITFDIPSNLKQDYIFNSGQHLTLKAYIYGQEIRRSYSICAAPQENTLKVAVKRLENGIFSNYANSSLKKGQLLDVMLPMGKFSPSLDKTHSKNYLLVAAGSGITPIISILKDILNTEPTSSITVIYGNRNTRSVMFKEELEGLKNLNLERLNLYFVLSREKMDAPLLSGRIDKEKCNAFFNTILNPKQFDEIFICGPEGMVFDMQETLLERGVSKNIIHTELFTTPGQTVQNKVEAKREFDPKKESLVTIKLDTKTFEFPLKYGAETILDAALEQGADLPFACKGGVCCTCRAKLVEGKVDMTINFGLEPDELEAGFILTCQAHPRSEKIVVDFDQK